MHYAIETYGRVDVYIHIFLTSALIGCEWSASRPGRFTTGESALGNIVLKAGWAPEWVWTKWRRENLVPAGSHVAVTSAVQPVASRHTDCIIPSMRV
jgi:hypothetical protein